MTLNLMMRNYAKWKKRGEDLVRESGLEYTILRPTWFNDEEEDCESVAERVEVSQGDTISIPRTRVSRKDVAEVCVATLLHRQATSNVTFEFINKAIKKKQEKEEGEKEKTETEEDKWELLFRGFKKD